MFTHEGPIVLPTSSTCTRYVFADMHAYDLLYYMHMVYYTCGNILYYHTHNDF